MARTRRVLLAMSLMLVGIFGLAGHASAERLPQDRLVSSDPVNWSPNILDGTVYAIAQVGNKMIVGGTFTQVKEVGNSTAFTRKYILAFDATTGKIDTSFVPKVDKTVFDLEVAPDGKSVYAAGAFNNVNGAALKGVALLNVANGATVTTFKPPYIDGIVRHIGLSGGRLFIGGSFTKVKNLSRAALASLNAGTGALDSYADLGFGGLHNGGSTKVWAFSISPDKKKMAIIGNFTQVGGEFRDQFVMLELGTGKATVANYYTKRFESRCSTSVEHYVRDVEFAPTGDYFVIVTTGAYYAGTLCDSAARFETDQSGTELQPTWVDYTGGDTLSAVAITGEAIYLGGHNRWLNNPFCADKACQGAVNRPGISAVNPINGVPFAWNPTRDRGHAVEDMVPTADGLWIGSDTDQVNGEYHAKIAKFPLAGGKEIPANNTGKLPGDIYMAGGIQTINPDDEVDRRSFDGTAAGSTTSVPNGGIDWSSARGAFMINGEVYYGASSGRFYRRTFNGTAYGAQNEINAADQLATQTTWHSEVGSITGMFYQGGRIYYTRSVTGVGAKLYYRYFTPESDIVGGEVYTASGDIPGVDWSTVRGMFFAGGKLYWADRTNGALKSVEFSGGLPVAGTAKTVDSANDWRARGLFLYAGPPNKAPTASFSSGCDARTCTFDGSASSDPNGQITGYAWDFGDGKTGTGVKPGHAYTADGSYEVKLTVTDDDGAKSSTTKTVAVTDNAIGYRTSGGANGNSNAPAVTVPAAVAPGDAMVLILTMNSSTVTVTTPPAGWTQVAVATSSGITSTVWKKVAAAGDAGSPVKVSLSGYAKADLRVLAYEGASGTDPVAAAVSKVDTVSSAVHVTPTANVTVGGSVVISYWSDKNTTTSWTASTTVETRATSGGGSTASISTLVADSGGSVPIGSYGGLTATASGAAAKAVMWTIVLRP